MDLSPTIVKEIEEQITSRSGPIHVHVVSNEKVYGHPKNRISLIASYVVFNKTVIITDIIAYEDILTDFFQDEPCYVVRIKKYTENYSLKRSDKNTPPSLTEHYGPIFSRSTKICC